MTPSEARSEAGRGKSGGAGKTAPVKGRPAKPSGRVTPKGPPPSGRYTPPIPKAQRSSPPWYPWVLLAFFVVGLAVIVVNYAGIFWTATDWALAAGIGAILVGTVMATRYR
jgi:hypothetical protein